MKKSFIWFGVCACVPFAAVAQSQVTDPASPVPTVLYRSVFTDTPKGVETDTLEWKAANSEVGQFARGHIDILKWEAAQAKSEASKPVMPMSHGAGMGSKKP